MMHRGTEAQRHRTRRETSILALWLLRQDGERPNDALDMASRGVLRDELSQSFQLHLVENDLEIPGQPVPPGASSPPEVVSGGRFERGTVGGETVGDGAHNFMSSLPIAPTSAPSSPTPIKMKKTVKISPAELCATSSRGDG